MTFPIDEEHLLFISMDNRDEEVELFKSINIKNISRLLDIGPTKL
ncbi:hypothetical protein NPIRD3C_0706 [Nitrosopumilus piranensis]|uniref:Uncharacterized protein n=1 Tax=Nitrosopumilus piranensis TaxID=1582439 RepID=A0A0C5BY78_9ARCH|nr:hypothetical protein NPIRD3C_0706 [Nitrosopumilus piranensis]